MNYNEAIDVLKSIAEIYPKFNVTKKKASLLVPHLQQMEYQGVMNNLSNYVANHPYAPTISEIAAYPPEPNDYFDRLNIWQKEADKVPEEVKQQFRLQFANLVKELSAHE